MRRKNLILTFLLCSLMVSTTGAADAKGPNLFSHGAGPIEIIMFTDYFCPPCRKIEPYLETAFEKLHRLGVKITFVDKPIHSITPLYSKYFLYASKTAASFSDILRIRSALFDIASANTVHTERDLLQKLKEKEIAYMLIDPAPIFSQWSQLIGQYQVKSTPTCIVLRPGEREIRYTGSRHIPAGIDLLLEELSRDA